MIDFIGTVCPLDMGGCGRAFRIPSIRGMQTQRLGHDCKCGKRWKVEIEYLKTEPNYDVGQVQSYHQLRFTENLDLPAERKACLEPP